jgi:hypothetical protein
LYRSANWLDLSVVRDILSQGMNTESFYVPSFVNDSGVSEPESRDHKHELGQQKKGPHNSQEGEWNDDSSKNETGGQNKSIGGLQ